MRLVFSEGASMGIADVLIVLIVVAVFALCVRSIVRSQRSGECADCASGGSCTAHRGGRCRESAKLMADASAAVARYESEKR